MYACNTVNEYLNSEENSQPTTRPEYPAEMESQTFHKLDGALFFQTASTTFRNFFTPDLLDSIDKVTEKQKRHAFESDAFRNILAFHFGKCYFENSLDTCWRRGIGIWGTSSDMNQEISVMNGYYEYFIFLKKQFGFDEEAMTCLVVSLNRYRKILNSLIEIMNNLNVDDFTMNDYFKRLFDSKNRLDLNFIFDNLVKYYRTCAEIRIHIRPEI